MGYQLETPDGDCWVFPTLDEARKNKYIFGGKITVVYLDADNYINQVYHKSGDVDSLTYLLELMGVEVLFDMNSDTYKIKGKEVK